MVDLDIFLSKKSSDPKKKWNVMGKILAIWDAFQNLLYAFLILAAIVFTVMFGTRYMISMPERNDTDPPDGYSGISVLIDNKTGCQYLASARGGMTPRLDKKGKHMCGDN